MATLNVEVSNEQYKKILEEAKKEVRRELTDAALEEYLKKDIHSKTLPEYLRLFDLYGKAEMLNDRMVKDLTRNEKAILAFTWLGYLDLFGR